MGFRLQHQESVAQGVKRIAQEQLSSAVAEIQNEELDRHEAVHQIRKRFKKIRGLIRLVRPVFQKTYQKENVIFRDAWSCVGKARMQSHHRGVDRRSRQPICLHNYQDSPPDRLAKPNQNSLSSGKPAEAGDYANNPGQTQHEWLKSKITLPGIENHLCRHNPR